MLASRPQIHKECMQNRKKFGKAILNSKFTQLLIIKYETCSFKICGILEIVAKFLAIKLYPSLNSNGLNGPGDAPTTAHGE